MQVYQTPQASMMAMHGAMPSKGAGRGKGDRAFVVCMVPVTYMQPPVMAMQGASHDFQQCDQSAGQQEYKTEARSETVWNTSVAPFVPEAQRRAGAAELSASASSAAELPAADSSAVAMNEPEVRRKGNIQNAHMKKNVRSKATVDTGSGVDAQDALAAVDRRVDTEPTSLIAEAANHSSTDISENAFARSGDAPFASGGAQMQFGWGAPPLQSSVQWFSREARAPHHGRQAHASHTQHAAGNWEKASKRQSHQPGKGANAHPTQKAHATQAVTAPKKAGPKKEEEEKPFSAAEFPTLGAPSKPQKGPAKKGKVGSEIPPPEAPAAQTNEREPRFDATAWGKSAKEAREQAAQRRATEAVAVADVPVQANDSEQKHDAEPAAVPETKVDESRPRFEGTPWGRKAKDLAVAVASPAPLAATTSAPEKIVHALPTPDGGEQCGKVDDVIASPVGATDSELKTDADLAIVPASQDAEFVAADAEPVEETKSVPIEAVDMEERQEAVEAEESEVPEDIENTHDTGGAENLAEAETKLILGIDGADERHEVDRQDLSASGSSEQEEVTEEGHAVQIESGDEQTHEQQSVNAATSEDCTIKADVALSPSASTCASGDEETPKSFLDSPTNNAFQDDDGLDVGVLSVMDVFAYRCFAFSVPEDLATLVVREHVDAWRNPASGAAEQPDTPTEAADRALFGSLRPRDSVNDSSRRENRRDRERQLRREPAERLQNLGNKAAHAYKRVDSGSLGRDAELKRCAQSLLNKICPENVQTIAKRIKEEAKVATIPEMELVISLVFKKALAEPHYCETYASMVFMLKGEMPSFANPDGGKDVTFKSILLNVCQAEFESMPQTLQPSPDEMAALDSEELAFKMSQQRARFLANMKFIGHLFLQQLLTTRIVAGIMAELVGAGDMVPEEHVVECICELLTAIGCTLEGMPAGKAPVEQVCGRLLDLKHSKKKDGKSLLSKRMQFSIQDVLDMRAAGWTKKTFKAVAKTKEEIRLDHEKDIEKAASGKAIGAAEYVVAGARPAFLQNNDSASAKDAPWQETKTRKSHR